MDVDDTPEEAAARAEARAWLKTVAKPRGEGDGDWRAFRARTADEDAAQLARAKAWQRTKCDAGWAAIHWPVEYGGRGRTGIEAGVFSEEEGRFDTTGNMFMIGIDMVGPTLITHGTADQKARFLPPMLRGDEVWCQLFSEPGSGSDLASLSTRAVRDGDEWVLDGQKVWTSSAHTADFGICLARTDPDAPKHAGITYFLVDMHSPGVTVRPLRQIDGAIHFNEVFLDGVRVPADRVVGDVHDGWRVAMTTLTAERTAIGSGGRVGTREIVDVAKRLGRTHDPVVRQEIARVRSREMVQRWTVYRVRTAVAKGVPPGPEAAILKLLNSHQVEHVGSLLMSILGAAGTLWHDDAPDDGFWQDMFLMQWSSRIGGGTEDIQRNILGERILGLPREPDPLKGAPWRDLPKS
ncbi:MAG TPA: acyl-CoA dehydrogenase family protein [Acidimicrobiales bacterium]|nr:acyl-CoA dehydrogenase family protein [Acidimicrobiales bacterium]